jgi:hypothetical protein
MRCISAAFLKVSSRGEALEVIVHLSHENREESFVGNLRAAGIRKSNLHKLIAGIIEQVPLVGFLPIDLPEFTLLR